MTPLDRLIEAIDWARARGIPVHINPKWSDVHWDDADSTWRWRGGPVHPLDTLLVFRQTPPYPCSSRSRAEGGHPDLTWAISWGVSYDYVRGFIQGLWGGLPVHFFPWCACTRGYRVGKRLRAFLIAEGLPDGDGPLECRDPLTPYDRIRLGVRWARIHGHPINPDQWGVRWDETRSAWVRYTGESVSPLGAVLLREQPPLGPCHPLDTYGCSSTVVRALSVSHRYIFGFFRASSDCRQNPWSAWLAWCSQTARGCRDGRRMGALLGTERRLRYIPTDGLTTTLRSQEQPNRQQRTAIGA